MVDTGPPLGPRSGARMRRRAQWTRYGWYGGNSRGGQEVGEWKGKTHAALILRLLDGGCPWLLTKRICLGGGRAPWIGVVIVEPS